MKQLTWRRVREAATAAGAPALIRGQDDLDMDDDVDVPGSDDDTDNTICAKCKGTGIDGADLCSTCNGAGSVMKESTSGPYWVYRDDPEWETLREDSRTFSTDVRKKYSAFGVAMSNGSYPIPDSDALSRAVSSFGHNATAAVKDHIKKRAAALGLTSKLPDDWSGTKEAGIANFGDKKAAPVGKDKKGNSKDGKDKKDNKDDKKGDDKPPWLKESEEVEGSVLERLEALEKDGAILRRLAEAKPASMTPTFSQPVRVKTSSGQDGYQVVLIREGKGNNADDQWYTSDCIQELCESGVAEGMQAYANHPDLEEEEKRPERDVKQLVGTYHDVKYVKEGNVARANAIFVPLSLDENNPQYGWVVTLAEAASRSTAPQPICGISLYGLSAGDDCERPDGSVGRMVSMIRPSSGDIVTNAGAGGGFIRQLIESARARKNQIKEMDPMQAAAFQQSYRDAAKRVREAASDEEREEAIKALEALETESLDRVPDSIEQLREAAPKLVDELIAQTKAEASQDVGKLTDENTRLRETVSGITDVIAINDALHAAGVEDPIQLRHFAAEAQKRGLREADPIKQMVEDERAYQKQQSDALLASMRESVSLDDLDLGVVGAIGRVPVPAGVADGGVEQMREVGIPLKETE